MELEQLQRAKEHITAHEYQEARAILMGMEHPVALKWLHKLDELELGDPFAETVDIPVESESPAPVQMIIEPPIAPPPAPKPPNTIPYSTQILQTMQAEGWELDYYKGMIYNFAKKSSPPRWVVVVLTLFFGLIGSAICSLIKLGGAKSFVSFEFMDDVVKIRSPQYLKDARVIDIQPVTHKIATTINKSVSHLFIWSCGIISWTIGFMVLSNNMARTPYYW